MGRHRSIWLSIGPAGVAFLGGYIAFIGGCGDRSPSAAQRIELPPPSSPTSTAAAPAVTFQDFVGADTCAECHREQYEAWSGSTHGQAGGAPARERIVAPFDGTPIRFSDAVVTPSVTADGDYVFTVAQEAFAEVVLRVDGVVGGGHMVGGGTQGFLSRHDDGTVRFLPFDFSRTNGVWFCNIGTRADEGWVPITEALSLSDCGDWPPTRILGLEPRFSNCQECHGSQIQVRFTGGAQPFETRFTTLAVNCESCHGPGRRHVELARTGQMGDRVDIGMRSLATLSEDESLAVCFRCHALKSALEPGYLPGESFQDHYSLKLPILGEQPFFADGRVRTFAYQQNHLYSDCYVTGTMTCVDCHEPHGQGYRDAFGRSLENRFSDGQCLGCHPSKIGRVQVHTHHPPNSPGSRCVACHMPYLQQPELGDALRYARSDHTIPIPRPAFDAGLGIETACQQCHADRDVEALQAVTDAWWGELKPHKPLVAGLVRAPTLTDRPAVASLVLAPEANHPIAQVAGLSHFLERFLAPDMPTLEPEIVESLEALAKSDDIDVKALALASLHLARGEDPDVRTFLSRSLAGLGAEDRPIRRRWATVLGDRGDAYRTRAQPAAAVVAYRKALEITPDNARIHLNLGLAYGAAGDLANAVAHYQRSLQLDPAQPLALVNLGIARAAQGDIDAAAAQYREAIRLNPYDPLPYFNLGNVYLRANQPARAIEFYQQATTRDPSNARAHFYLARASILVGEYASALEAVRRGLAFEPEDETGRQMLVDLERVVQEQ